MSKAGWVAVVALAAAIVYLEVRYRQANQPNDPLTSHDVLDQNAPHDGATSGPTVEGAGAHVYPSTVPASAFTHSTALQDEYRTPEGKTAFSTGHVSLIGRPIG